MRKHTQQMNAGERGFIHGFIRANADKLWASQGHFTDRASERHFSLNEVKDAVRCGLVVEVHNDKAPDVRALVRRNNGTCVVVSLASWEVITVYYNDPEDKHETLNWNAYRWPVNVVELVKSFVRIAGKDYGADPVGDGTFRMVPSGDVVDLAERNRRLS